MDNHNNPCGRKTKENKDPKDLKDLSSLQSGSHTQSSSSAPSPQRPSSSSSSSSSMSLKLPPSLLPRRSHTRPNQSLNLLGATKRATGRSSKSGLTNDEQNDCVNVQKKQSSVSSSSLSSPAASTAPATDTSSTTTSTNSLPTRRLIIGGPGTILPFFVESTIVWILAISCLWVSCWHYIVQVYGSRFRAKPNDQQQQQQQQQQSSTTTSSTHDDHHDDILGLQLCTHSRREIDSVSTIKGVLNRYEQLVERLEVERSVDEWLHPQHRSEFIKFIRSTEVVRRLVSLIMTRQDVLLPTRNANTTSKKGSESSSSRKSQQQQSLSEVLQETWPQLLELPTLTGGDDNETCTDDDRYICDISVIMPLYREDGSDLKRKLQTAVDGIQSHHNHFHHQQQLDTSQTNNEKEMSKKEDPTTPKIEFILVNAGQCRSLDVIYDWLGCKNSNKKTDQVPTNSSTYPRPNDGVSIRIYNYLDGGGRGPCLNYGAKLAKGRILTFLHADTRLVPGWDVAILNAFETSSSETNSNNNKKTMSITTACAFSFAIDTSPNALRARNNNGHYVSYPPGIKAIEATANWRTHLFHLPYGDQCLSIPSHIFDYVGGYPDQCLLEDYELIRLLRQRVAVMRTLTSSTTRLATTGDYNTMEQLKILSLKAYCSPRRWQAYGVWYVTYMNSHVINKYANGSTPDELFALYYGTSNFPPRRTNQSPWEIQLEHELELADGADRDLSDCLLGD